MVGCRICSLAIGLAGIWWRVAGVARALHPSASAFFPKRHGLAPPVHDDDGGDDGGFVFTTAAASDRSAVALRAPATCQQRPLRTGYSASALLPLSGPTPTAPILLHGGLCRGVAHLVGHRNASLQGLAPGPGSLGGGHRSRWSLLPRRGSACLVLPDGQPPAGGVASMVGSSAGSTARGSGGGLLGGVGPPLPLLSACP